MNDLMISYIVSIAILLYAYKMIQKLLGKSLFHTTSRYAKKTVKFAKKGTVKTANAAKAISKASTKRIRRQFALPSRIKNRFQKRRTKMQKRKH